MSDVVSLRDEFTRLRDRPFVFVAPGGNWGDGLIWWGGEQLASSLGMSFRSIDLNAFLEARIEPDAVLFVHGGGGFNRWCSGRSEVALLRAVTTHPGIVIQGPCTFEDSAEYAAKVFAAANGKVRSERVVLFTRECVSQSLLSATAPAWVHVGLDVDAAFHVSRDAFLARAGICRQTYDLLGVREDNEVRQAGEFNNLRGVRFDPAKYAKSFERWLRLHAAARTIVTSRTHSSIAGAILGTPTVLLPGSYHKNHSIWEYSLKDRGVVWGEPLPPSLQKTPLAVAARDAFLSATRRSYRLNRLAMRLRGVPS